MVRLTHRVHLSRTYPLLQTICYQNLLYVRVSNKSSLFIVQREKQSRIQELGGMRESCRSFQDDFHFVDSSSATDQIGSELRNILQQG